MLRDTPGRAFDFSTVVDLSIGVPKNRRSKSLACQRMLSWQAMSKRKLSMQEQSKGASGMLVLGGEVLCHQANAIAEACILLL